MTENKIDDSGLENDTRPLVVEGKRYFAKTDQVCPACGRTLYLKMKLSGTAVLECAVCETVVHTAEALIKTVD